MHEIITLQLGQRSNYLATHFWNTQESYFTYAGQEESPVDHDVHFRAGIGADGSDTYTPRTLIYDLKGGFGSLRKLNALYEAQEDPGLPRGLWDGNVVVQAQPAIDPTEYQLSLDQGLPPPRLTSEAVRYWSDFNRVFYHPRSIVQLNEYELNSQLMPFESYAAGDELFNNIDKEHDILDRDVRPFAEECDQLQGFQLFAGTDDAWGGFTARYVDRLKDEYGKNSIWVWGLENGHRAQRQHQMLRMANMARSINEISPLCSAYIPISDPPASIPRYLALDRDSEWQTAALVATAIESVTLPSRLRLIRGNHGSLEAIETVLNSNGNQRIFQLRSSILGQGQLNGHANDEQHSMTTNGFGHGLHGQGSAYNLEEDAMEDNSHNDYDLDFTPRSLETVLPRRVHQFGRVEVIREASSAEAGTDQDAQEEHRSRRGLDGESKQDKYKLGLLFPLIDSFPHSLVPASSQSRNLAVKSSLSTTTEVAERIKAIRRVISRSIGIEEREELTNGLGEICDAYEEGYDSGSDSDEDDD